MEAAKYLKLVAEQNEEDIDSSYYYSAGYDSPYVIFNRRNEVWYTKNKTTANQLSISCTVVQIKHVYVSNFDRLSQEKLES